MLQVRNLHVSIDGQKILRGIDLDVQPGTVHAVMGPNGSGKSTLASVLAGRDGYEIEEGSVTYNGQDLLDMDPEIRAREGVFLAFQYPVEVPGVTTMYFMRGRQRGAQASRRRGAQRRGVPQAGPPKDRPSGHGCRHAQARH